MLIGLAGWEGKTREHSTQAETICQISLVMPGQKYRPLAKAVVLNIPEWLACKSLRMGLTEGKGSIILFESIRISPSERERMLK